MWQGFHAVILPHFASMLYIVEKCHNKLLPYLQLKGLLVKYEKYGTLSINDVTQEGEEGGVCTFVTLE